jgi:hypothetical protein
VGKFVSEKIKSQKGKREREREKRERDLCTYLVNFELRSRSIHIYIPASLEYFFLACGANFELCGLCRGKSCEISVLD